MKRIPCATYRLQFNRQFTFQQAAEILDYLGELGVSDIYASPLLEAGPESTHGYDTCSFERIHANLGSGADFDRLTKALKEREMGLLLDVVPNHMSATLANPWWCDVLENGPKSAYAHFFDVDWQPHNPALQGKVLLPVLEDEYAKVLESGKLRLTFESGKFFIAYHERNFPVRPGSVLVGNDPSAIVNDAKGIPGNAGSFAKLDGLIQRQHYRLAYWKAASHEINYRRFFDVTEMVALKMELPDVFQKTHGLIFEWLAAGKVTGLRVDHPDGLWDPKEYLDRLQNHVPTYVVVEKILSGDEQLPGDWAAEGTTGYDFLNRVNGLFVDSSNTASFDELYRELAGNPVDFEEIVYYSRKQVLERAFCSELNGLTYRLKEIAGRAGDGHDFTFSELRSATAEIIANFSVYRTYVTEASTEISGPDREVIQGAVKAARARAGSEIKQAVFEFIEKLLLLKASGGLADAVSRNARAWVMKFQQLTGPAMAKGLEDTAFYRFNRLISLNEVGGDPGRFGVSPAEFHEANLTISKRWPHTMLATATHDTKRGEDSRARLNVLSETPAEWRAAVSRWLRLNRNQKTLAENVPAPDANDEYLLYQTLIGAWPDDADTADGLKSFRARVAAFTLKAAKEAKLHTSWTDANAGYEKALQDFVERVLGDNGNQVFLDDARRFSRRIAFFGRFNSLAQTLLKMTSPGIPDTYQGSELWDLNLVDPDNRRPIDYERRRNLLSDLKKKFDIVQAGRGEFFSGLLRDEQAGAMKLFLIWRVLNFRRKHRELFDDARYVPLAAVGEKQNHVVAFARESKERLIVVVAPRLVLGLTEGEELPPIDVRVWKDTTLTLPLAPAGTLFRNVLTGEMAATIDHDGNTALEMGQVLKFFPVALLEKI